MSFLPRSRFLSCSRSRFRRALQGHSRRRVDAGFTLMEVMIALLILSMALGVMIRTSAYNLSAARDAEMMGVSAELARSKMYDLEEQLIADGFQEIDQSLDGDFADEGWSNIKWKADIVKIELPNVSALGGEGEGGEGGGPSGLLGGVAGMIPGLGGEGGLDSATAQGAALIGSQWELVSQVLEQALRKVTLTLTWNVGRTTDSLVIDAYFTEPAAISRSVLGRLAGAGGNSGGGGDGNNQGKDTQRNGRQGDRGNNRQGNGRKGTR